MSTQLDTDLATLVGEMEEVACEHSQHETNPFHSDEAASHYLLGRCPVLRPEGTVYPACPGLVKAVQSYRQVRCGHCGDIHPTPEVFTILGPVNK